LEDWTTLKEIIKELVKAEDKICILGCGNAEFSEDMYDDGYTNMHNIDISSVVIEQMKFRNKDRSKMTWDVMDVTDMKGFGDEEFDMAIDKSTIDALL
jgi:2-polyprenyl-3-methyl-5-hydroxy-6-metoxy-1,4-benzoquinol methylase